MRFLVVKWPHRLAHRTVTAVLLRERLWGVSLTQLRSAVERVDKIRNEFFDRLGILRWRKMLTTQRRFHIHCTPLGGRAWSRRWCRQWWVCPWCWGRMMVIHPWVKYMAWSRLPNAATSGRLLYGARKRWLLRPRKFWTPHQVWEKARRELDRMAWCFRSSPQPPDYWRMLIHVVPVKDGWVLTLSALVIASEPPGVHKLGAWRTLGPLGGRALAKGICWFARFPASILKAHPYRVKGLLYAREKLKVRCCREGGAHHLRQLLGALEGRGAGERHDPQRGSDAAALDLPGE